MNQLKVLAIASEQYTGKIARLLEGENINRMLTLKPDLELIDRAAAMPVDAVVLMTESLSDEESFFIERLYMTRGGLAFIMISEQVDSDVLSRAMACGITRVYPSYVNRDELHRNIAAEADRIRSRSETAGVREFDSRVLSVFSTKGGTGKTTVAVNLAVALQRTGKKVAIVDLDLQFGDVGVFLNIPRNDTISDLASEQNLSPSVVNSYLYRHETGVRVMLAPVSPELAELVKSEHIDRILTVLRAEFDYVICDLAPALDDVTLFTLDRSDTVYFITNPEIPTLRNTRTCMNILQALNLAGKIRFVLNREGDEYVKLKDVSSVLDAVPVFCLPNDPKTSAAAMNRGIPVLVSAPKSKLAKALTDFARHEAMPQKSKGSGLFLKNKLQKGD